MYPNGSFFDALPDELLLKIVQMATKANSVTYFLSYNHFNLDKLDTISKLSSKFNRIAQDQSFWRGTVKVESHMKHQALQYMNKGTTQLVFMGDQKGTELTPQEISSIASKCPKLETLYLSKVKVRSWPNLRKPWMLKNLTLFGTGCGNIDAFEGKGLHLMLPKLEYLYVFLSTEEVMTVPKKSMFQNLSKMTLGGGGTFRTLAGEVIANPESFLEL